MKTHITIFAIVTLFLAGTYSSVGQEVDKKQQEEYALKKKQYAEAQKLEAQKAEMKHTEMTSEEIAKKQTLHLQQLLDLDDKQTLRIHEICSSVENEMAKIPANIAEEKRMALIKNLEGTRDEKFKEALTADQFIIYQNSIKNEKR